MTKIYILPLQCLQNHHGKTTSHMIHCMWPVHTTRSIISAQGHTHNAKIMQ